MKAFLFHSLSRGWLDNRTNRTGPWRYRNFVAFITFLFPQVNRLVLVIKALLTKDIFANPGEIFRRPHGGKFARSSLNKCRRRSNAKVADSEFHRSDADGGYQLRQIVAIAKWKSGMRTAWHGGEVLSHPRRDGLG